MVTANSKDGSALSTAQTVQSPTAKAVDDKLLNSLSR